MEDCGSSRCGSVKGTWRVSMRMQVGSLAWISRLRFWGGRELWCRSQTQLGSHIAVTVGRPAAAAQIGPLVWELPYACAALEKKKKSTHLWWSKIMWEKRMYIGMCNLVTLLNGRKLTEHCKPAIMEKIKIIIKKTKQNCVWSLAQDLHKLKGSKKRERKNTFFFFFLLFRTVSVAYGSSQARGRNGAVAASLPTATVTRDPSCVCDLHRNSRHQLHPDP